MTALLRCDCLGCQEDDDSQRKPTTIPKRATTPQGCSPARVPGLLLRPIDAATMEGAAGLGCQQALAAALQHAEGAAPERLALAVDHAQATLEESARGSAWGAYLGPVGSELVVYHQVDAPVASRQQDLVTTHGMGHEGSFQI